MSIHDYIIWCGEFNRKNPDLCTENMRVKVFVGNSLKKVIIVHEKIILGETQDL